MPTQPITTTISTDKSYGPELASKNIIAAIESMAKIKQEQVNFQKSLMLDELTRKRDTAQKLAQKRGELQVEQDFLDQNTPWYAQGQGVQPRAPQPTPTAENKAPAMSLMSGGTGNIQGQPVQPQQTQEQISAQPVILDNIQFPHPKEIWKDENLKETLKANKIPLMIYAQAYQQFERGAGNEGGRKILESAFNIKQKDKEELKLKQQELLNTTRIRQEFINRPEVKEYVTVSTNVKSMDSLLKSALSGNMNNKVALDQALITMYNKLTDPQSVVRESEYARTQENLPFANRFKGAFQKLEQGGAGLTDKDREALVWGAKVIANERGKTYNQTLTEYEDLALQYDLDPSMITRGIPEHEEFGGEAVGEEAVNSDFVEGKVYRDAQGNRAVYQNGQWINVQ